MGAPASMAPPGPQPAEQWPALTIVSGPAGAGKTTLVLDRLDPTTAVWVSLRDQRYGSELAARLVRHLRARLAHLPPLVTAAVGPSSGPVGATDGARAEQLGALLAAALGTALDREQLLVIDELERIDDDPIAMRLVESLVRNAPAALRTVLVTRTRLPFATTRLGVDASVVEIEPSPLTSIQAESVLSRVVAELAELGPARQAAGSAGVPTPDVEAMLALAHGWPGPLRALGVALALAGGIDRGGGAFESIRGSPDPAASAVAYAVGQLAAGDRRALADAVALHSVSANELSRLGVDQPETLLADLTRLGLVEPIEDSRHRFRPARDVADHEAGRAGGAPNDETVDELGLDVDVDRVERRVMVAAGRGDPAVAISAAVRGGASKLLVATLERYGRAAIEAGHAELVLSATTASGDPHVSWLAGRAAHALGDAEAAAAAYERAAGVEVRAGDAWRHGLLAYFLGDNSAAAAIYARGLDCVDGDRDGESDAEADTAMLAGYAGAAAWISGDLDAARSLAERALSGATAAGDDRALAVAYTLAAMVAASEGDRAANDWNYVRALQHAERAGDLLQVARIRSNRGSRLLEEGEYHAALAELDDAVRHADVGGFGVLLALALSNRGEVLTRLGRLDDARTDLDQAVGLMQRQASRMVAYPLVVLARMFVMRGDHEQARAASERAMALAAASNDRQIGVSARMLLARSLAARDPVAARRHAEAALDLAGDELGSLDTAELLTVIAELASAAGDDDDARRSAARAADIARQRHDRYALAAALEVSAQLDRERGRARLDEAHALFVELGCEIDAARLEVRQIQRDASPSAAAIAPLRLAKIVDRARRLGARPVAAMAEEAWHEREVGNTQRMHVNVLGSFGIVNGDERVQNNAWQSKKARDLFKMLAVLDGRPLPRDQAIERLWPEDGDERGGDRSASKLSVALATIRSVLDPAKQHPADHFVIADADAIRLDPERFDSDLRRFLTQAAIALRAWREQRTSGAIELLAAAEGAYGGDVLEVDAYVDWCVAAREEARAQYLAVAAALAQARTDAGDTDDAIRLWLRLLEREPYDERAHLALVTALLAVGRHGDARRRYQHYCERMRELDLEPSPFPSTTRT